MVSAAAVRASDAVISLVVRPIGDTCNLRCTYCYLGEKVRAPLRVMSGETLGRLTSDAASMAARVQFLWHGGEPLLAGSTFFGEALRLQGSGGAIFENLVQTNGTLLDEHWARFFALHGFQVRLSLDGPQVVHDLHRRNGAGRGSHVQVTAAIRLLREVGIAPQVSCVVTEQTAPRITEVYEFLRDEGIAEISFIPAFLRVDGAVHETTLTPASFVRVYSTLFNLWAEDRQEVRVREVEAMVSGLVGHPTGDCTFTGACALIVRVEADGTVLPCELHTGEDAEAYGRVGEEPLSEILARRFNGRIARLSRQVQSSVAVHNCRWSRLCHGGCYATHAARRDGPQGYFYCCEARGEVFSYISSRLEALVGIPQVSEASNRPPVVA